MRFKLDENLYIGLAEILTEGGHDTATVLSERLSGGRDIRHPRVPTTPNEQFLGDSPNHGIVPWSADACDSSTNAAVISSVPPVEPDSSRALFRPSTTSSTRTSLGELLYAA